MAIVSLPGASSAQDPSANDVVSIEEHWELHVGGPEVSRSAPQVTMVMSPVHHLNGLYYLITINHWSYPDFSAGGVQLQRWDGEDCLTQDGGYSGAPLAMDGETITWVQRMSLANDQLTFEVVDRSSVSWGTFGAHGNLRSVVPTSLQRLNDYHPAVSLEGSGIGYAGNRVSSLTLKRLVWHTADGERHELVAPIDISTKIGE